MGTAAAPPQPQLLLSFATYLLLLSSWCSENVESVWFRAVLIPQHKFQQLGGGRPPTPMTLQLCRSPKKFVPTCRDWKWEKGSPSTIQWEVVVETGLSKAFGHVCRLEWHWTDVWVIIVSWTLEGRTLHILCLIFSRKNLIQLSTYQIFWEFLS